MSYPYCAATELPCLGLHMPLESMHTVQSTQQLLKHMFLESMRQDHSNLTCTCMQVLSSLSVSWDSGAYNWQSNSPSFCVRSDFIRHLYGLRTVLLHGILRIRGRLSVVSSQHHVGYAVHDNGL